MSNQPGIPDVRLFLRKASDIGSVVRAAADAAIARLDEIEANQAGHITGAVTGTTVAGGAVTGVVITDTIGVTSDLDLRWNVAAPIDPGIVQRAAEAMGDVTVWGVRTVVGGALEQIGSHFGDYTYGEVHDLAQHIITFVMNLH